MSARVFYVYILASQRNGTLYTGVTNDLARRMSEHRTGAGSKFVSDYRVSRLVWCEAHEEAAQAIQREKQIKKWNRKWKLDLIEASNPQWRDLYDELNF